MKANFRYAARNSSARRGVLLLVVLALLAIFGLIAVAFVVLTGHAQRNAKTIAKIDQTTDPPKNQLQQALMHLLRGPTTNAAGTPNPASIMGAHSLLEDMYGNNWVSGTINSAGTVSGFAQLLDINQSSVSATEIARRGGCVLTITGPRTSPCYGQSTRIIAINPSAANFQVMAFPDKTLPRQGDTFIINGVPFSGTGFGYNSSTGKMDLMADWDSTSKKWVLGSGSMTVALMPNLPMSAYSGSSYVFGGANSNYTAADFQHMLLGAQVPVQVGVQWQIQTLPSLHRPALLRYWANQNGGTLTTDLLRLTMMRPIGKMAGTISGDLDHPNFDGSNPKFNPEWNGAFVDGDGDGICDYAWDVDNNGDGVPDSIWVDLGMPVRSTADGRLYKPLFAILCVDLDGRLNLNAHGSLAQFDTSALISPAGGTSTDNGIRGQGFGPAEISLLPLMGTGGTTTYSQLLVGGTSSGYLGRYGTRGLPGSADLDLVFANKWFAYGQNFWDFSAVNNAGSFGSPLDPFGVGGVTLDAAGRPDYKWTTTGHYGFGSGINNTPYQLNLGPNAIRGLANTLNSPFSPAELERLLRPYDRDAPCLPARLLALSETTPGDQTTSVLLANKTAMLSFTTESWDPPCPNPVMVTTASGTLTRTYPPSGGVVAQQVQHVTDMLATRGIPATKWAELLPPEMLVGLKMNLNRPFGNGRDDSGDVNNPVVDGPAEITSQSVTLGGVPPVAVNPISLDGINAGATPVTYYTSGGTVSRPATSQWARQLEARYLYVLMCLTCDLRYLNTQLGSSEATARYIAQWAVNVVDFRDRDSIMTSFDFDPEFAKPSGTISGGWSPPCDPVHRVWGCERPELLISETLAFHDRRTEDLADFGYVNPPTANDKKETEEDDKVNDFDQTYLPQGSLFVELYNPASPMEPRSGDLYTGSNGALELTKKSANTSGAKSPVWRLAIAQPTADDEQPDPDDSTAAPHIERAVYFVDKASVTGGVPTAGAERGDVQFYPTNPPVTTVSPGGYAIIGPGEKSGPNPKRTYIGFRNGATAGDNSTRYIDLDANPLPVQNNSQTDPDASVVNSPARLAIDEPRHLSVSEPADDYDKTGLDPTSGKFNPPLDMPLDAKRTDGGEALKVDGTTPKYRVIYLQRLANPLLPYDATDNPYCTIDQMAVDVTAFNGVTEKADPDAAGVATHFESRQRGEKNDDVNRFNIWKQEPTQKSVWGPEPPDLSLATPAIAQHYLNKGLKHSLGYLNQPFGAPQANAATGEKGLPTNPFPWLTWNNRPWVSPLELMLVPTLRSSKLLVNAGKLPSDNEYSKYFRVLPNGAAAPKPYEPASATMIAETLAGPDVPYPHLMNFFQSAAGTASGPEFHRILDYLGVPSPFVGTETWANPMLAGGTATHPYHPPFNGISAYREPGRINLNTIYSQEVFNGLMAGCANAKPTWAEFKQSRRGSGGDILDPPGTVPTEFAHPFRSFSGANLVPTGVGLEPAQNREINATLLREGLTAGRPLFDYDKTTTDPLADPLSACQDTNRNPYFRYQALQRLGNLVTTRSNVYAIWITVGYFEVTPATTVHPTWTTAQIQAAFPDGYCLGRELGVDTGEIERHRGFYIIDRTIPVGFKRGEDLNAEKAILLNRFIE